MPPSGAFSYLAHKGVDTRGSRKGDGAWAGGAWTGGALGAERVPGKSGWPMRMSTIVSHNAGWIRAWLYLVGNLVNH